MGIVKCAARAPRETPVRELIAVLSAPVQDGYPPAMNSDAPRGLSHMGYQSSDVAFSSRGLVGRLLVRLVGTTSCASSATKRNLPQGAKWDTASVAPDHSRGFTCIVCPGCI